MVESYPIGIENTVEKGEIDHYEQFLLFLNKTSISPNSKHL